MFYASCIDGGLGAIYEQFPFLQQSRLKRLSLLATRKEQGISFVKFINTLKTNRDGDQTYMGCEPSPKADICMCCAFKHVFYILHGYLGDNDKTKKQTTLFPMLK